MSTRSFSFISRQLPLAALALALAAPAFAQIVPGLPPAINSQGFVAPEPPPAQTAAPVQTPSFDSNGNPIIPPEQDESNAASNAASNATSQPAPQPQDPGPLPGTFR